MEEWLGISHDRTQTEQSIISKTAVEHSRNSITLCIR